MTKKIAFCITCMNRLSHIQETLVRNIDDNFNVNDVEFVLLDYNSSDNLENWIKTLIPFLDLKILSYYRNLIPEDYQRSHSRNMAFRLADAEIVCNLDADNFLGKGFADHIIDEFSATQDNLFITSSLMQRDSFGRLCVKKNNFMKIGGYNEDLSGYGVEDIDLYSRFLAFGLEHRPIENSSFESTIRHSNFERVSQESQLKNTYALYVSYVSPYLIKFIIINKDHTCELGSLKNNLLCNFNQNKRSANIIDSHMDKDVRVLLDGEITEWKWDDINNNICIILDGEPEFFDKNSSTVFHKEELYYKILN